MKPNYKAFLHLRSTLQELPKSFFSKLDSSEKKIFDELITTIDANFTPKRVSKNHTKSFEPNSEDFNPRGIIMSLNLSKITENSRYRLKRFTFGLMRCLYREMVRKKKPASQETKTEPEQEGLRAGLGRRQKRMSKNVVILMRKKQEKMLRNFLFGAWLKECRFVLFRRAFLGKTLLGVVRKRKKDEFCRIFKRNRIDILYFCSVLKGAVNRRVLVCFEMVKVIGIYRNLQNPIEVFSRPMLSLHIADKLELLNFKLPGLSQDLKIGNSKMDIEEPLGRRKGSKQVTGYGTVEISKLGLLEKNRKFWAFGILIELYSADRILQINISALLKTLGKIFSALQLSALESIKNYSSGIFRALLAKDSQNLKEKTFFFYKKIKSIIKKLELKKKIIVFVTLQNYHDNSKAKIPKSKLNNIFQILRQHLFNRLYVSFSEIKEKSAVFLIKSRAFYFLLQSLMTKKTQSFQRFSFTKIRVEAKGTPVFYVNLIEKKIVNLMIRDSFKKIKDFSIKIGHFRYLRSVITKILTEKIYFKRLSSCFIKWQNYSEEYNLALELGMIYGKEVTRKYEWCHHRHYRSNSKEDIPEVNYFIGARSRLYSEILV